jgi:hypothetical protein
MEKTTTGTPQRSSLKSRERIANYPKVVDMKVLGLSLQHSSIKSKERIINYPKWCH